jgi:hypothetical protein
VQLTSKALLPTIFAQKTVAYHAPDAMERHSS